MALFEVLSLCYGILIPPPRFDHKPFVSPPILYLSPELVRTVCQGNPTWVACTRWHNGVPFEIIIPDTGSKQYIACLLRHEYGHVNGWNKDHSNV